MLLDRRRRCRSIRHRHNDDPQGEVLSVNAPAIAVVPGLRRGEPVSRGLRVPELLDAIRRTIASDVPQRVEFSERVPVERWYEARVGALLRRSSPERIADVLAFGNLELDREKKRVWRAGHAIDLGPTEFRLLEFLMERPGRVFSREQLLDGVWGRDVYIDERAVDVHVGRLRKALNRGHAGDPIRTVRGAGYALDDKFAETA